VTAKAYKWVQFGYGNYLIDTKKAVIVDAEATPARTYDEAGATKPMIEPDRAVLRAEAQAACRDTAYGTGKLLGWLVNDKRIMPRIRVWEKSARVDDIFSRADFIWDKRHGHYVCPNGEKLRTSGTVHDGRALLYRASKRDCDVCPSRQRCCNRAEARRIPRDIHESARKCGSPENEDPFARSRDERKRVEMRFAHLKTHYGFERLRLRGPSGARDEFHLAAIRAEPQTMALRLVWPVPVAFRSVGASPLAAVGRSRTTPPQLSVGIPHSMSSASVSWCHCSSMLMYSRMRCVSSPMFLSTRTRSPLLLLITPCCLNRRSVASVSRSLWHCSTSTLSVANWCSFGFAIKVSHCCL
jgi:hypothetical protein